ncbi:hypothetical protein MHTCC0001_15000 [Flavobacteriaceae bacterium MHTCC 0001]
MNKIYATLINLGVNENLNASYKKVRLLNSYVLIWLHLEVLLTIVGIIEGSYLERTLFHHLITVVIIGALLVSVLLNVKKKFVYARSLFIFTAFLTFFASSNIVHPGTYTEYFFLLIPGFAMSLYDKHLFPILFSILAYLGFMMSYFIFDIYPQDYIPRLEVLGPLPLFIALYFLINYFKKLNQHNEKLLELERDEVISDKIILEHQEKELRKLNEFKSHFFVNLSHEIRTPLTLIQGYTSQIKENTSSAQIKEKLEVVEEQANQMQSIINDIMDLSKMDTNEFSINTEEVLIKGFLEKIFSNFKPLFDKKHIDFCITTTHKDISICIDEGLFQKAINNLLNNALKFTASGGTVLLTSSIVNNSFRISIKDSGIGIPKQELSNIFERFYQVKNDITKSQGSGIGLAFTKSIVEAHQFRITAHSEEGKYTEFSIDIPQYNYKYINIDLQPTKKPDTSGLINKEVKKERLPIHQQQTPKILIVEDHEQMRNYIESVLEGYRVSKASNGKEALSLLNHENFDLVLTDYMMPIMDGEALVKQIKRLGYKVPVLVLTARTDNHGKLNMLRMGIDGYLHKPFLKEELILQVKNALQLYHNIKTYESNLSDEEKESLNTYADKFHTKINQFIQKNLNSETFGVEDIASHMNMSKSTLNRKLKILVGQSANHLIIETRLQMARSYLLENPLANKKDIAKKVGMSNTTYLFKKMEERFGSTKS